MTINQRIRQIRKDAGLNQKEFAAQLGLTQSGVSYMEQPDSTVADSSIKTICSIYNLNEEWLRHGTEPKNLVANTFSLDNFVDSKGGTSEEKEMLKEAIQLYFEFEPYVRQSILNTYMSKVHPPRTRNPLFDGIPDTPEELEKMYTVIDVKNSKDIG